jgi:hypothetical protein
VPLGGRADELEPQRFGLSLKVTGARAAAHGAPSGSQYGRKHTLCLSRRP